MIRRAQHRWLMRFIILKVVYTIDWPKFIFSLMTWSKNTISNLLVNST